MRGLLTAQSRVYKLKKDYINFLKKHIPISLNKWPVIFVTFMDPNSG